MSDIKEVYVYENWKNSIPSKIGTIYIDGGRGKEVLSFEYDEDWINNIEESFIFDPDLSLYRGRQYTPFDKSMFGVFADSCPDRWGRLLVI